MLTGKKELIELLRERCREGPIAFRQFMELALYHPRHGYYASSAKRIGRRGDYITSPHQSPLFGRLVAKGLEEMWHALGRPPIFNLFEFGAGAGWLCKDILEGALSLGPGFSKVLRYFIVEPFPAWEREQRELLQGLPHKGPPLSWLKPHSWREGLESSGTEGCVLANEFLDALPVHRLALEGDELRELYLAFEGGEFSEVSGPLSQERLAGYFPRVGLSPPEGFRGEVNLAALDWLAEVAPALRKGFILIFDYGFSARELFSPERRDGTLACYYRHGLSHNPYERVGGQDITAHLDFTSLLLEGGELGLELTGFTDQAHYLMGLGLMEELEALGGGEKPQGRETMHEVLRAKALLDSAGLGAKIKVLVLHKGIKRPELRALSLKPFDRGSYRDLMALGGRDEAAPR
ncbi:MAG: class I SAM-dependent methyltransferase [Nitrospinota bacterium]